MPVNNINFKNKTILITGGTKGIGIGITNSFLKLDANVIVLARNKPSRNIQSKGNAAFFVECDIRDLDSIAKALKIIQTRYKKLDVLKRNIQYRCGFGVSRRQIVKASRQCNRFWITKPIY